VKLWKIMSILCVFLILKSYSESYTLYHTVKKGENLYVIAKKYGKTPEEIKNLNNLKENTIYPGQKIAIEKKGKEGKNTVKKETKNVSTVEKEGNFIKQYYTVKKGDS